MLPARVHALLDSGFAGILALEASCVGCDTLSSPLVPPFVGGALGGGRAPGLSAARCPLPRHGVLCSACAALCAACFLEPWPSRFLADWLKQADRPSLTTLSWGPMGLEPAWMQ